MLLPGIKVANSIGCLTYHMEIHRSARKVKTEHLICLLDWTCVLGDPLGQIVGWRGDWGGKRKGIRGKGVYGGEGGGGRGEGGGEKGGREGAVFLLSPFSPNPLFHHFISSNVPVSWWTSDLPLGSLRMMNMQHNGKLNSATLGYQQIVIAALLHLNCLKSFLRIPFPKASYTIENMRHERTSAECVIMKSRVAKHYGCKHARHCGLIANGCSQANHSYKPFAQASPKLQYPWDYDKVKLTYQSYEQALQSLL